VGGIADGYLATSNTYDGYMYIYGKGQSTTTVNAPQTEILAGHKAIISGTVLDQSPAQLGTPCVSKESMTQWMEHLHMQHDTPSNVIGVPVSIDAVDPNGNTVHIGDAVSDMSGTFSFTWTPTISGDYKISASFMGDDSYGRSWAETHATVVDAPAASATPSAISFDSVNNTIVTGLTVVGVAIIIAIAVAVLLLRKRA
jgi:hypothetical protein